jgi:SNF2 family DNA or RNA helicase
MSVKFTPRPWQPPIIQHILDTPRAGVFAGMGLGKTTAAMTALDYMFMTGDVRGPVLVCAPLRVASSTWPDEAKKWSHLRHLTVQPVLGNPQQRRQALSNKNASVFTINYENLPWMIEYLESQKKDWPFDMVIADESTKLKGFRLRQGGQRARALATVAHKYADRWVNLTGTPASNGLKDLWGQTWFLDAGERLGRTYSAFESRWFRPSHDGFGVDPLPFAQEQIESRLKDICLSLDIRDYVDIAEPITSTVYVDLPTKARRLYDEMEKKMYTQINGHEVEAFNAASRTMKCLQLANGAAYVGENSEKWEEVHDAKIQALDEIVGAANGAPVLVAYHFKSDLARLLKSFPRGRHLDADPRTVQAWNRAELPVLFAHPASAGHGLNLQDGGNTLVFFGHNWNLEEYLQIIERIGPTRQLQAGHNRPVFIYHIVARDTVDEIVMARRESKREVQDLLLEAMKRKGIT